MVYIVENPSKGSPGGLQCHGSKSPRGHVSQYILCITGEPLLSRGELLHSGNEPKNKQVVSLRTMVFLPGRRAGWCGIDLVDDPGSLISMEISVKNDEALF